MSSIYNGLRKIDRLFKEDKNFSQGTCASTLPVRKGIESRSAKFVEVTDPEATAWCIGGACMKIQGENTGFGSDAEYKFMQTTLREYKKYHSESIPSFNDKATFHEIKLFLRYCINKARREGV